MARMFGDVFTVSQRQMVVSLDWLRPVPVRRPRFDRMAAEGPALSILEVAPLPTPQTRSTMPRGHAGSVLVELWCLGLPRCWWLGPWPFPSV